MRAKRLAALLIAAALTLGAIPAAAETGAQRHRYDVFLDDRLIGTHSFEIDRGSGAKQVRSRAEFQVKVLMVALYRYEHSADERWQDGCLRELASQTDDNGRRFEVRIDPAGPALKIERRSPKEATELIALDCPGTFAYWDPEQLERSALINSQTGALTPVRFSHVGTDRIAGEPADRYRLEPEGLDPILLWYRASDRLWLQLETTRENRVLRYRLAGVEPLPDPDARPGASAR
jgi:hypothetical protein